MSVTRILGVRRDHGVAKLREQLLDLLPPTVRKQYAGASIE